MNYEIKALKISSVRMTTTLSEEQVAEYKEAFTLFDLGNNTCLSYFSLILTRDSRPYGEVSNIDVALFWPGVLEKLSHLLYPSLTEMVMVQFQ